jgi:hypothetical protein
MRSEPVETAPNMRLSLSKTAPNMRSEPIEDRP